MDEKSYDVWVIQWPTKQLQEPINNTVCLYSTSRTPAIFSSQQEFQQLQDVSFNWYPLKEETLLQCFLSLSYIDCNTPKVILPLFFVGTQVTIASIFTGLIYNKLDVDEQDAKRVLALLELHRLSC